MNKSKILYIFCLFRVGVGAFVITSVFCTLIYTGFYALAAGLLLVSGIIFYYRSLIGQTINNNLQQQTSDWLCCTTVLVAQTHRPYNYPEEVEAAALLTLSAARLNISEVL